MRAALEKNTRWVDVAMNMPIRQRCRLTHRHQVDLAFSFDQVRALSHQRGHDELVDDGPAGFVGKILLSIPADNHAVIMLRGQNDRVNSVGGAICVVLNRNLALRVRSYKGELLVTPHGGMVFDQAVRQVNGQRHQAAGFIAGKTEHHPLITCATRIDTHGDVLGLGVEVAVDLAGVGRETDCWVDIADITDGVSHQFVDYRPG